MKSRWTLVAVALLLLAMGAGLIWSARPQDPPPPPVPTAEVSVPSASPKGPVEAPIEGNTMNADKMAPNTVFIPAIRAYAPIVDSPGFNRRNDLILPEDPHVLARWAKGAPLGSNNHNILLAGHIVYNNKNGALFEMGNLTAGDRAFVKDANGKVTEFVLVQRKTVLKADLPDSVWDTKDPSLRLTIVTCGGPVTVTEHGRQFRDNVIGVFFPVE